jgi:hypothetical protein
MLLDNKVCSLYSVDAFLKDALLSLRLLLLVVLVTLSADIHVTASHVFT